MKDKKKPTTVNSRTAWLKRWDPAKPFSATNQPTPEQKKAGWDRKREAKRIMDQIMQLQNLTVEELKELYNKDNVHLHKVKDIISFKYVDWIMRNPRMLIDRLNRHISYAPIKWDLKTSSPQITSAVEKLNILIDNSKRKKSKK